MRLLIATHARGPIGGIETYVRTIAPALAARGHSLALVYENRHENTVLAESNPLAACQAEWGLEVQGLAAVFAGVRGWRPDVVWIHGLHSAALEEGLLELAPGVLFVHNYDGVCATGAKFLHWPPSHACIRPFGAACAVINYTRGCGIRRPDAFAASFRRQLQRREAFPRYRRIMVASAHMQREIARALPGGAPPVEVVLLPLPTPRLETLPARAAAPHRLVMLSRLTRPKGAAVALEAMARVQPRLGRPLSLSIAGEGPERATLAALAGRLQLDVKFFGWLTDEQCQGLLAQSDLLVFPSLGPEPFGFAGIEAAALGVPAVAFAVGGISEWLVPGVTGEWAPGERPTAEGFAAALERALTDPAHWQQMRTGAWTHSLRFAIEPHLDRLEAALA